MKIKLACEICAKERKSGWIWDSYFWYIKSLDDRVKFKQGFYKLEVPDWQYHRYNEGDTLLISFYEEDGRLFPVEKEC